MISWSGHAGFFYVAVTLKTNDLKVKFFLISEFGFNITSQMNNKT